MTITKRRREIEALIDALQDYWYTHPHARLGQIVTHAAAEMMADGTAFHVQDEDVRRYLVSGGRDASTREGT